MTSSKPRDRTARPRQLVPVHADLAPAPTARVPPRGQLLKWVGNKQRFAAAIASLLPEHYDTYREPFIGSGAVLSAMAPRSAVAGDVLGPLIGLWQTLQRDPGEVCRWYEDRWRRYTHGDRLAVYQSIRTAYNEAPNAADLLFLSRSCYGGVIRFSKAGLMNTPPGIHRPIDPALFAERARQWHDRVRHVQFVHGDFEGVIDAAGPGDVVYCDPPYVDSEATLYGAQGFSFGRLLAALSRAKGRGVRVALSIDGSKQSGRHICEVPLVAGLFETEVGVDVGRSMLRRFQMAGRTLEQEKVRDRLLLSWTA